MGVNINTTIALTFFLGSALAGAAGIVYGLNFGTISFTMGFSAGLKAFTAAVLGGIGNLTGAVLGGFIIGFIEVITRAAGLCALVGGGGVRGPDHRARVPTVRPARPAAG